MCVIAFKAKTNISLAAAALKRVLLKLRSLHTLTWKYLPLNSVDVDYFLVNMHGMRLQDSFVPETYGWGYIAVLLLNFPKTTGNWKATHLTHTMHKLSLLVRPCAYY